MLLDHNRAERALRNIALGRKNWLFADSDQHAAHLAHTYSLEASARLHGLDVAVYFRDLIRVLPYWPPVTSFPGERDLPRAWRMRVSVLPVGGLRTSWEE